MPYIVVKVKDKNCWKVMNVITGRVHSECSTKSNATKQLNLLNRLDSL